MRPVSDPAQRRSILTSGGPVSAASVIESSAQDPRSARQTFAGRELLLECYTSDLGQPRADGWLWFKNGQPIKELPNLSASKTQHQSTANNPSNTNDELAGDFVQRNASHNPITGHEPNVFSSAHSQPPTTTISANIVSTQLNRRDGQSYTTTREELLQQQQRQLRASDEHPNIKLISSGRYLFIPSIQLVHKGNYSCVAVNRLGIGSDQSTSKHSSATTTTTAVIMERDSFPLRVALAPSFVQPLATRTYWPETYITASEAKDQSDNHHRQLELVCHVQCDPICQIEWLRNNEPLDLRRQAESLNSNYVTYQVKNSVMDENVDANQFKSVHSKLIMQFQDSSSSSLRRIDRDKTLERRALLNGSNYTCQSSPNSMGAPVRSTTKFVVQCEYFATTLALTKQS